ncbi:hypothetical protein [Nocardia camponoti]|uniref:Uncharacterized protein n=1 Tax=Nocardia camponoti TaxID=1616106 RepID=A0A917QLT6_9NOCA|nr:hypothetical protein [Nocardia camponoti]GGK57041.1 hypothetical protein GCM10011591_31440 [Nocardia camponoti]
MTKTADELLNEGTSGLRYFELFGPLYARAFGGAFDYLALCQLYDTEREMNLASLSAMSTALGQVVSTATSNIGTQETVAKGFSNGWKGNAAEAAAGTLTKIASLASGDRDLVNALATSVNKAATEFPGLIAAKATTVKGLVSGPFPTVAGLSAAEVEQVIAGKSSGTLPSIMLQSKLTGHRSDTGQLDVEDLTKNANGTQGFLDAVKGICDDWLTTVFKKDFEAKERTFREQCTTTKDAIERSFAGINTAADAIPQGSRHYPSVSGSDAPAGKPDSDKSTLNGNGNGGGNPTAPANTDTGGKDTGSKDTSTGNKGTTTSPSDTTTPATTTGTPKTTTGDKTTTTDDTSTSVLDTLTSTLSSLGDTISDTLTSELSSTLTSALESASTAISSAIAEISEQAGNLLAGGEASFQLGSTTVTIDPGPDGLSLTATGTDGQSAQYRLTLDEHGVPVIVTDTDASKSEGADANGGNGTGTPTLGSGKGEAGLGDGGSRDASVATPTDPKTPDLSNTPVTSDTGTGKPETGAGGATTGPSPAPSAGMPGAAIPNQGQDGEHRPTVQDHPVAAVPDTGAELAEAGPL